MVRRRRGSSEGEPDPQPPAPLPAFDVEASAELRRAFHSASDPITAPPIRTVLVDVATELERGFWDAPLWLPVGATLEGGPDLWEIVSVRLIMPLATGGPGRPVLYLYARHIEA